jgi:hypothetical protein
MLDLGAGDEESAGLGQQQVEGMKIVQLADIISAAT